MGHDMLILSASMENWLMPFARYLEIDRVEGTQLEVSPDGRLTGKFLSKNCYGEEKVIRLRSRLPNREEFHLIAYGDSRGDKELLNYADEAFYRRF